VRIVHPGNELADTLNGQQRDAVPFRQSRATIRAYIAELRREVSELRAARWPRNVQPYITAMIATDWPDTIRCYQAVAQERSWTQAEDLAFTNQACMAAANSTTPDTVRARLGLPPRQ
jgi:hypothetical protein